MVDEKDTFYVMHKGNVIAVYKNLSDLQALLRSFVSEPAINVYKGYHLAKQSEEYLASHSLKNAMYFMDFSDVRDDLLGIPMPCPFQQPVFLKDKIIGKNFQEKRMQMRRSCRHKGIVVPGSVEDINKELSTIGMNYSFLDNEGSKKHIIIKNILVNRR
ncbi:hypothetical protein T459_11752 [Capsicum annuum]|uniref:Uncharacterized protein n=1 Tax=Capsicum annuum TaxID=4072 RepID=A0A2G2ZMU6_CAPAN|nr:hypothetical protein T459_11752 [Capsicum annuum]